jgi:hypothetical protein
LIETVQGVNDDVKKFDGGNKSAGTRVRKAMQDIKVIAQEIRETVSEIKNAEK